MSGGRDRRNDDRSADHIRRREIAGRLRERITVERIVVRRDPLAAAVDQMRVVGDYWAAAAADGHGEAAVAGHRSARQRWRFTLRYPVNGGDRLIRPGDEIIWARRRLTVLMVGESRQPTPLLIVQAEEQ